MLELNPDKALLYASAPIMARRKRLLRETRRLIAMDGYKNFSVRRLCQQADVAPRTLYNAFHDKDRLIALAIREAFDEFNNGVHYRTDPNTLSGVLDRTLGVNERNFHVRNYAHAICTIYFAPGTSKDVWKTLQDMSLSGTLQWMSILKSTGQVQPWVNIDHFADTMANLQYATINDWCLGRLSDEQYLPRIAEGMLLLIVGAMRDQAREESEKFLFELKESGEIPRFPAAVWKAPRQRDAGQSHG
jgi:AcrR family transcriptional regulator